MALNPNFSGPASSARQIPTFAYSSSESLGAGFIVVIKIPRHTPAPAIVNLRGAWFRVRGEVLSISDQGRLTSMHRICAISSR